MYYFWTISFIGNVLCVLIEFKRFPPNKIENLMSWISEVVSRMFTMDGWGQGGGGQQIECK